MENADVLRAMTGIISHRGPDDEGAWINGPIALGHRRLSILDLSPAGHQPMVDEKRGRAIAFNGEIYNYRDLRPRLLASGIALRSTSDTEVLLKMADFATTAWLHSLNGMFAFALWDTASQTLLLVRDRFGVKPLYWSILGTQLIFASEQKALLLYPGFNRNVRLDAIPEFLAFRSLLGSATLFESVYELPPGHLLQVRPDGSSPTIKRWFHDAADAPTGDWVDPRTSLEDQFVSLFSDAVRYRLIADVPVGTYNSGGVDSSLTTSIARNFSTGDFHTFSVAISEAGYDESHWALKVAKQCDTQHHVLTIDSNEFADGLPATIWFNDEPLNHPNTVALLRLSALARRFVTVVLTGEGADETFGGYPRYQIPLLSRFLRWAPRILTSAAYHTFRKLGARRIAKLLEVCGDPWRAIIESQRFIPSTDLQALGIFTSEPPERRHLLELLAGLPLDELEKLLIYDRATYLPSLLHRLDRTTMAHGLEGRLPFLDYRLQEWAKTVPAAQKIRLGRENKVLLKKIAAQTFPMEMIYRRKMGFDVPLSEWLRAPKGLGRYLDLLTDDTFRARSTFDANAVSRLVDDHRKLRANHGEALWTLINVEIWMRTFVDRIPPPTPVSL